MSARGITKIYGATQALKGVDFDIRRGAVTALFGENGAGKSTLMKILSGVESPDHRVRSSSTASPGPDRSPSTPPTAASRSSTRN